MAHKIIYFDLSFLNSGLLSYNLQSVKCTLFGVCGSVRLEGFGTPVEIQNVFITPKSSLMLFVGHLPPSPVSGNHPPDFYPCGGIAPILQK